jgi:hypothetical protein
LNFAFLHSQGFENVTAIREFCGVTPVNIARWSLKIVRYPITVFLVAVSGYDECLVEDKDSVRA